MPLDFIIDDLPSIPGNSPLGSLLPGNCSSAGLQKVNASPPSSGETAVCSNRKSPRSINGQAYDANTGTPLSPHELSSQRSGAVYQPLASQSNCCPVNSQAAKGDTNELPPTLNAPLLTPPQPVPKQTVRRTGLLLGILPLAKQRPQPPQPYFKPED
ncbi:hypothetical protein PCANC_19301 [Puccinia coronata f. sp. avenae]|uniref:Uncharacterized protein n=1 Tax=Puccinia coronata f. sp. avenae TaxID=200324 RepID=A0A2N5ULY8_9BASI|nr:hypothetical protein PCANC_19301 [Puccinia coronata f. sp. avenae]